MLGFSSLFGGHHVLQENPFWQFQVAVRQEYLGKSFTENTGTEKMKENTSYSSILLQK